MVIDISESNLHRGKLSHKNFSKLFCLNLEKIVEVSPQTEFEKQFFLKDQLPNSLQKEP